MINHTLQGTAARDLAKLLRVHVLVKGSGARLPDDPLVLQCLKDDQADRVCLPLSDSARVLGERVLEVASTRPKQHEAVVFLLEVARACERKGTTGTR